MLTPLELAFGWVKKWIKKHARGDPLSLSDPSGFLSKAFAASAAHGGEVFQEVRVVKGY